MTRHLELMRTPHDAPPNWLLMLYAYLDESGQETDEHVIVAGFVGTEEQWIRLKEEWRKGLGKRKALHMKALRWNGKRSDRTRLLLERLGPIPRNCGLIPICGSVRVSDYADLVGDTILTEKLSQGYLVAMNALLGGLMIYVSLVDEHIKVVCEQQDQFAVLASLVGRLFEALSIFHTDSGKPRLSGIEFVPKGSTSLTEPADYLAFAVLQKRRDPLSRKSKWCSTILSSKPFLEIALTREMARRYFSSPIHGEILRFGGKLDSLIRKRREELGLVKKRGTPKKG